MGADARGATPAVVVGIPLYQRAEYLPAALDSLVGQSYRDVAFVLVDDNSTDATPELARRYAAKDARVVFRRTETRLGLVGNWRRSYEECRRLFPAARYFAWGSDHDVWEHDWLDTLVAELDVHDDAVLAYPESVRISESGEVLRDPWHFDTAGVPTSFGRFRRVSRSVAAGSMIYGLFRVEALERTGGLRPVVGPDRLLLAELAVHGEFRQVRRVLWRRRFVEEVSDARQRASFFPERRAPFPAHLPWWLVHGAILGWRLGIVGAGRPSLGRAAGLLAAGLYTATAAARRIRRRLRRARVTTRRLGPRRASGSASASKPAS